MHRYGIRQHACEANAANFHQRIARKSTLNNERVRIRPRSPTFEFESCQRVFPTNSTSSIINRSHIRRREKTVALEDERTQREGDCFECELHCLRRIHIVDFEVLNMRTDARGGSIDRKREEETSRRSGEDFHILSQVHLFGRKQR